ncbi:MAG: hypothetical protein WCG47_02755 [Dermatophilaceae bacterium]
MPPSQRTVFILREAPSYDYPALTALVLGVLTGPSAAASSAAASATREDSQVRAPVPRLDWTPCGPAGEGFECATAQALAAALRRGQN